MRDLSTPLLDDTFLQMSLPLVPGLTQHLEHGIDVLDVGCGAGHAINLMARAFPRSRFTGYDFCDEALVPARAEAAAWRLANATLVAQDVATMEDRRRFDFITAISAIHDQAQPRKVLAGIARALRPDADGRGLQARGRPCSARCVQFSAKPSTSPKLH
jgi:ubiquinone/menaquinone biosynthesis C-methylase UbiE